MKENIKQVISSKDNETIKHIKKLSEKKYRDENKEYIIEGIKILEEAIQEKVEITEIIICKESMENNEIPLSLIKKIEDYQNKNYQNKNYQNINCRNDIYKNEIKFTYVTEKVFKTLTQLNSPQGIIAIVKKIDNTEIRYNEDVIVVLDDIQDPGNLGTILRTVDSIGLRQIIVSKKTADVYNPKVIRSTMGAIFRINVIIKKDIIEAIEEMKYNNYKLVVTSLQTENKIYDINYNKKIIVMGNEANGVEGIIQDMADEKIKIPMLGKTESLNVSVATGIVLYEYVRQKLDYEK